MEKYAIEVKDVYKIFGNHPKKVYTLLEKGISKEEILEKTGNTVAVQNVSFKVKPKETFVVMGLSGSGKSTLIRTLNRLIEPTSGEIIVHGENITKSDKKQLREFRRHKMSMVFQRFALLPHKTIQKNVEYGLEIQGIDKNERKKKAYESLELVGLKGYENSYPSELSGGMQQRVGLARALATDPDILLMDEAFSALDPLIKKDMQDQLLELQEKVHKTIIFITNDLDEALKLGNRIAIMKDGKIVQIGTAEEILSNPADDYVREFVQDVDRSKVILAESIMQKPIERLFPSDSPKLALRKMRHAGISSALVTSTNRKLLGIAYLDDVINATKDNEIHSIENLIKSNIPKVKKDTSIMDIMPHSVDTDTPVAVVDDNDILLGIIVKVSLLSGIIGEVN